jgi:hypothetical protein
VQVSYAAVVFRSGPGLSRSAIRSRRASTSRFETSRIRPRCRVRILPVRTQLRTLWCVRSRRLAASLTEISGSSGLASWRTGGLRAARTASRW